MSIASLQRVALVVHPARPIAEPVAVLRHWAERHGLDVVEIHSLGSVDRDVAPDGIAQSGDLVVAIGGDGTVLSALRAAAQVDAPVLGTACGSLGALATVTARDLGDVTREVTVTRELTRRSVGSDTTEAGMRATGVQPTGTLPKVAFGVGKPQGRFDGP